MASKDHGLTPIELSSFCSEIALMLGAGMPLYAGMEALEKTYEARCATRWRARTLSRPIWWRCAAWASARVIWRT